MDRKQDIIVLLDKLRKKETADKNTWKARAYSVVIKQIKELSGEVRSFDDLAGVKGIGDSIKEKIMEIFETGTLKQAEEYNADNSYEQMNELMKVHGIGPAKAKELVSKHNIKSISDLKQHPELLNDKQKIALKYTEDFDLRIPRGEMKKHEAVIKAIIAGINPNLVVEVVGSYRRGAKDSGDIDVLITDPSEQEASADSMDKFLRDVVAKMNKEKYTYDAFALGNKKYLGVSRVKYGRHFRRLDLLVTHKHEFPFALLYFTGSQQFNVEMRNYCIEKGYSLSEYGLKYLSGEKKGQFVDHRFITEEDVFKFLGLVYVAPKDRGTNSIVPIKSS